MLRSKATEALQRLKEIDRKYSAKRNEIERLTSNMFSDSTSDSSIESKNFRYESKEISSVSSKSKFAPRILERRLNTDSSPKKLSDSEEIDTSAKLKMNFRKTQQESLVVEKANLSETNETYVYGKSKINVKIPNVRMEHDTDYFPASESERGSSEKFSKSYVDVDENLQKTERDSLVIGKSKVSSDVKIKTDANVEFPIVEKSAESVENIGDSNLIDESHFTDDTTIREENINSNARRFEDSKSNDYETTIEEAVKSSEEKSEISEESRAAEGMDDKESSLNDFAKFDEISYKSDTFEDVSSSTISTKSGGEGIKIALTLKEGALNEETARSGVKQIEITPYKQFEASRKNIDDERDKEIVELIAPKVMQSTSECEIDLDEELSNYVKISESIDPQELKPICLLKSPKQATSSTRKQGRKVRKYGRSSKENTERSRATMDSSEISDHEISMENQSRVINMDEEAYRERSSELISLSERKENVQRKSGDEKEEILETEKDSVSIEQNGIGNDKLESNEVENQNILEEIPMKLEDATCILRKLNRDAIDAIAKRRRIYETGGKFRKTEHCRNCGTFVTLPLANAETVGKINARANDVVSEENIRTEEKCRERKSRTKGTKSSKTRRSMNRVKIEEKSSRFDCKRIQRLKKQVAALKLQKERDQIRSYLLELERTRLEVGAGEHSFAFKPQTITPLDFPKIAAFLPPDTEDLEAKSSEQIRELQERLSRIREWLKDQYILYRDYSSAAQTVNAKYVPATLEDAKKEIERNKEKGPFKMHRKREHAQNNGKAVRGTNKETKRGRMRVSADEEVYSLKEAYESFNERILFGFRRFAGYRERQLKRGDRTFLRSSQRERIKVRRDSRTHNEPV